MKKRDIKKIKKIVLLGCISSIKCDNSNILDKATSKLSQLHAKEVNSASYDVVKCSITVIQTVADIFLKNKLAHLNDKKGNDFLLTFCILSLKKLRKMYLVKTSYIDIINDVYSRLGKMLNNDEFFNDIEEILLKIDLIIGGETRNIQ